MFSNPEQEKNKISVAEDFFSKYKDNCINYSINLLWLNRTLDQDQKYIYDENIGEALINSAIMWHQANPDSLINIWYDSALSTLEAIHNSIQELAKLASNSNIKFKDIRNISFISNNPDIFSEYMPLYFRIDLLKLILCLHEVQAESNDAAIISDIYVKSVPSEILFNNLTIEKFKIIGLVNNQGESNENQFLQVIKEPKILHTLQHIINVNVMRGAYALNLPEGDTKNNYLTNLYHSPFFSTIFGIAQHYFSINSAGRIMVRENLIETGEWQEYNLNKHGYLPFGDIVRGSFGDTCISTVLVKGLFSEIPINTNVVLQFLNSTNEKLDIRSKKLEGRDDIDCRPGTYHQDVWGSKKTPADGSSVYKCMFCEDVEKLKDTPIKGLNF